MAEVIYAVVKQMTDKFSHAGLSFSPKKNTALEPIVQEILAPIEKEFGQFSTANDLVAHINDKFDDGDHTFDYKADDEEPVIGVAVEAFKEAAFEELRPVVIGLVKKTKEVALPAVNSIIDKAYEIVSDDVNTGNLRLTMESDRTDDPVWILDYLQNTLFNAATNDSGNAVPVVSKRVSFRNYDDSQLEELIKTGDTYTDNVINEYLNRFNRHEALEYSYHRTFRAVPKNTHECQCPMLHAFLSLLMAFRFVEETPTGVTGESLEIFDFEMAKVINYWVGVLKEQLSFAKYRADHGLFINSYQEHGNEFSGNGKIVVNGLLLDRFEEEIGDIDVIYGASVSNRPVDFDTLKERAEAYRNRWLEFYKVSQGIRNDNFQTIFCSAIVREVRAFAKEFNYTLNEGALKEIFTDLTYTSLNNETAFGYARKYIVNALFQDNNINKLLDNADEFMDKNSDDECSLDVALEIALIDLLAEWAIAQMDIKG